MDKKLTTTTIGLAVGATLLVGAAGFGIYKYLRKKSGKESVKDAVGDAVSRVGNLFPTYLGNSLVKSNSLALGAESDLIGGGLYKA